MTTNTLHSMLKDLAVHNRDKRLLLDSYIQLRLDTSLANYYTELVQSCRSLARKDAGKVLKYLNKYER